MINDEAEFFGIPVQISGAIQPDVVYFEAELTGKIHTWHCVKLDPGEEQQAFWAAQREVWRIAPAEREVVSVHYILEHMTFEKCRHLFSTKKES